MDDSTGALALRARTALHRIRHDIQAPLVARNCPRDIGSPQGRPAWTIARPVNPAYHKSLAVLGDATVRDLRIVEDAACRNARPQSCHLATRLLSEREYPVHHSLHQCASRRNPRPRESGPDSADAAMRRSLVRIASPGLCGSAHSHGVAGIRCKRFAEIASSMRGLARDARVRCCSAADRCRGRWSAAASEAPRSGSSPMMLPPPPACKRRTGERVQVGSSTRRGTRRASCARRRSSGRAAPRTLFAPSRRTRSCHERARGETCAWARGTRQGRAAAGIVAVEGTRSLW